MTDLFIAILIMFVSAVISYVVQNFNLILEKRSHILLVWGIFSQSRMWWQHYGLSLVFRVTHSPKAFVRALKQGLIMWPSWPQIISNLPSCLSLSLPSSGSLVMDLFRRTRASFVDVLCGPAVVKEWRLKAWLSPKAWACTDPISAWNKG